MKIIKKLTCLILSVMLILALTLPALAEAPPPPPSHDVSMYPIIQIQGSTSALFFNENTPEQKIAFENSTEKFEESASPVLDDIFGGFVRLDWNRVADGFIGFIRNWVGNLEMNLDGTPVHPGITRTGGHLAYWHNGQFKSPPLRNGELVDNHAGFWFDWRKDPYDLADELNDYIKLIKKTTNQPKVNLIAVSGSGAMTLAYINRYGCGDLASVMLAQSLHAGSDMMGQLATKKFKLNSAALEGTRVLSLFGLNDFQEQIDPYISLAYKTGLARVLEAFLSFASKRIVDRLYDEAITPLMFQLPEFWGFVPDKYYEEAKELLGDDTPEWKAFFDKMDLYHYEVKVRADEIIQQAAKEIKVLIACGYNLPAFPLGESDDVLNTDAFVEISLASFGAIAAPYGKTLSDEEIVNDCGHEGHNHLSPDRQIDASTCALPEQTWFFRDLMHQMETSFNGLYEWFLTAENPTVFSNQMYPQFMKTVSQNNYAPLPEPPPKGFPWNYVINAIFAGALVCVTVLYINLKRKTRASV